MTPEERRSQAASIAALTRVAKVGGTRVSAPARQQANYGRFMLQIPDADKLSADELNRRITALRRAHMKRAAMKSAEARRRRAHDR